MKRKRISPQEATEIAERFRRGETCLREERARFGHGTNDELRRVLKPLLGRQYRSMMVKSGRARRGAYGPRAQKAKAPRSAASPDLMNELRPIGIGVVEQVPLSRDRVLRVQVIGGQLRITLGTRVERVHSDSVVLAGSVLFPLDDLPHVLAALKETERQRRRGRLTFSGSLPDR